MTPIPEQITILLSRPGLLDGVDPDYRDTLTAAPSTNPDKAEEK